MKYILLFTLFILSPIYANYNDFSIIIEKPFNDSFTDVTQDYDRKVSAVGFTNNYNTNPNNQREFDNPFDYLDSLSKNSGTNMQLVKLDKFANILINKSIPLESFAKAVSVIKTPKNGYIIGGHTFDGSIIVTKVNSYGTIIFTKKYGTKNYDRLTRLTKLRDGGVVAIGTSSTSRDMNDKIFETGLGLNDAYITRFSKNGEILWSKKYGTTQDDTGVDAVEANDGSLIIINSSIVDTKKQLSIMRLSENGNKIWKKTIASKDILNPNRIIKLRDNNFLLSATTIDGNNVEQIRMIKFDLHQNILIDRTIETVYSSSIKDIKEYSNGNIIGVGYTKDTYNTDGLAMKLDSNLELLFQEHFGDENFDAFNSVKILNNSQAVIAGLNTNKDSQESNMWILKINRDLTLAQKSLKSFDFYLELLKLFKREIATHKLEIKEDLSIKFLDKSLYFAVAQYKLTRSQKIILDIFSKKLLTFMYNHKELIQTLEINGHTSSEWRSANFSTGYIKNEKLSMNRSFSVLSYMFNKQNMKIKKWLVQILRGSGFSYAKKTIIQGIEDKDKSRRVSFKIILK